MDMFQKINDRNIECCELNFVFESYCPNLLVNV